MSILGNEKRNKRIKRHKRIRARVYGTSTRPRLSVHRSNNYVRAQLVDDIAGATLVAASDIGTRERTKTDRARDVGRQLAQRAASANITEVVFDRGGFAYTGRVRSLAEGAREGGLQF